MQPTIDNYNFLSGGGEMGDLIRAHDWTATPLGNPEHWPESLKTMTSVILDNPFGMYIAWGKDFTQIYNNGYRPILGITKHPQALGISSRQTFSEIWHIIGPMFEDVMHGKPVRLEDFRLDLNRNGYPEPCYFDFSYSPIRTHDGTVGGVLVTVLETTNKKKTEEALLESSDQLMFAIEAAELGTYDYSPLTEKFSANLRLRKWFGLPESGDILLPDAINAIVAEDKERVIEAINNATSFESGGFYNIIYTVINPATRVSTVIHAKGIASFNDDKIAYRLNGTLQDITERYHIEESKRKLVAILDASDEFIGLADMSTQAQYINPAGLKMLGWEECKGRKIMDCVYPEDRDKAVDILQERLEKGSFKKEIRFWNEKTGLPFWLQWNGISIKDAVTGVITGLATVSPNITEQKIAEEKIKISENNLRLMILQVPVGIAILRGREYIVEIANKNALEILGRREEELAQRPVLEAMPELKSQGIKELLDSVYETGQRVYFGELPLQLVRNGKLETVYINFSYEALYDESGNINGIMAIGIDVNEQVLARQKIQVSEEKLNLIIDASELGVWEYNLITETSVVSDRCLDILGFKGQRQMKHEELLKRLHPDDLPIRNAAFERAFETGTLHYEVRVVHEDKSIHWIENHGKVFYDADLRPERMIGTLRDVTAARVIQQEILEREQQFRVLAESMPQHVWTSDPEGNLNYYNQSVFDFSGLTLEQIDKDGWLQIVHPDDREENIRQWTKSIAEGSDFIYEHRFKRYDGKYRWQLSRAVPLRDENGKIKMWVGTSTDIDDQKTLASNLEKLVAERTSELEQKNIDLEKINQELKSFAYISSHDLQEPLRKIQTFSSRILSQEIQNLSDTAKNDFARIQNSARRMQVLIEDLLAYSRTGNTDGKFEFVPLKEIVEEVKQELMEELNSKGAILETSELCHVKIIPFQFQQLLHNLITNSLKFSKPHCTPHITIKSKTAQGAEFNLEQLSENRHYAHISISDNGIGFEPQYSEKIFELFQRLNGRDKYQGTGIGLAIVKKIVENHNGVVTAKSNINSGATFDIYIPAS